MSEWAREANVDCVVAPCCGFVFAAEHTDVDGGGYSCPACENIRLREAVLEKDQALLVASAALITCGRPEAARMCRAAAEQGGPFSVREP